MFFRTNMCAQKPPTPQDRMNDIASVDCVLSSWSLKDSAHHLLHLVALTNDGNPRGIKIITVHYF